MAEQGAAPAPSASQADVPGGAGGPPGDTTIPRDRLADGRCPHGIAAKRGPAPRRRRGGAPEGERPPSMGATPQGVDCKDAPSGAPPPHFGEGRDCRRTRRLANNTGGGALACPSGYAL